MLVVKILKKIRSVVKMLLSSSVEETLRLKRCYRKSVVYPGGFFCAESKDCISGKSLLRFNASHYMIHCRRYVKSGILRIFKGGRLVIGDDEKGAVTFFQGCKVDVFPTGRLEIGDGTFINDSCRIGSKELVRIGKNCLIGDDVSIHDFDGHKINGSEGIKPVIIEDNVWIGENVTILKGVRIGKGSVIGAGSLVCKDIPDGSLAVGSPAKVIKENITWQP